MRWICAERDGTAVGVVAVDLNDFKLVNDNLGHPVGDDLLSRRRQAAAEFRPRRRYRGPARR